MGSVWIGEGEAATILRAEDLPGGFPGVWKPSFAARRRALPSRQRSPVFLAIIGADRREAFLRSHPALVLKLLKSQ
jgi:hypothetical protein